MASTVTTTALVEKPVASVGGDGARQRSPRAPSAWLARSALRGLGRPAPPHHGVK